MRATLLLLVFFFWSALYGQSTIIYSPSAADFPNPERGFYRYSEARSGNYVTLDSNTLASYRQLHTPPTAGYAVYSTLVFRYFFLEDFKMTDISQAYLDSMQVDFDAARAAGIKLIPRFAYTDEVNSAGCGNWICPPYGDAPKSQVLANITQLQPLLEDNKDVIAAIQMGFIGVWGENYYTDYFGDASQPPDYKLTDQNWTDRTDVLNALLDATPDERMVQVRYPQIKQRTVYGINAPTSSNPITENEAFSTSQKARIGFHNDCLLASPDDYGTYTDYGNSSTPSMADTSDLKPYFAKDSRFVAVGGETCDDTYSPQNDCSGTDPQAFGNSELERMHFSYLNAQYNNDVNNDWVTGGCIDEIKRRLGYRLELQEGTFSNTAQPGQVIDIQLTLKNTGYAAPFNKRRLEIILRNTATAELWFAALSEDARFWLAGDSIYTINETLCIPETMPQANYEVLLNLPDPMPTIYHQPAYSIRLANQLPNGSDVWEESTGYNRLGHFITIDNTASNPNCSNEPSFSQNSPILTSIQSDFSQEGENSRQLHHAIYLYPNPAHQQVRFGFKEKIPKINRVSILNILGEEVIRINGQPNAIDVSGFSSGTYFVVFEMNNGKIGKKLMIN